MTNKNADLNKKIKGFGWIPIIIAVGVLALLVGGGWYVQKHGFILRNQTQKIPDQKSEEIDTSGWKTYRSDKYRFEVKYPDKAFPAQISGQICDPSDTPQSYSEIEYSFGVVKVATQGTKAFCGTLDSNLNYEAMMQNLNIGDGVVILTGFIGKNKLQHGEVLQFDPDDKNTIYLSISPGYGGPSSPTDLEYRDVKNTLLHIIQTYKSLQ